MLHLDKKIREAVCKIMNMGLEIGRHYKINMVITNHLPTNGRDTRIFDEASSFTYFPHSANAKIKYCSTEYVGVDKKMITYFKRQHTRALTNFLKNYPMCYLCEREVGLLNAAEDDDD